MRKDKENAIQMRLNGKSYREIKAALNIPLGTLSDWFSKEEWSDSIRQKLTETAQEKSTARLRALGAVRSSHLKRAYEEARVEAAHELNALKYNPLFIAGLMLYWGEGDKRSRSAVRLSNTDPEMIKLFGLFLREACRIPEEKLRCSVLVYPDLDEIACRRHWSAYSGISLTQFTKSSLIVGRHKTRRVSHGVCIVSFSSTYMKVKMLEWLRLLPQELMKREYYESI